MLISAPMPKWVCFYKTLGADLSIIGYNKVVCVFLSYREYKKLALDSRLPLALFQSLSASDYVAAQRFR